MTEVKLTKGELRNQELKCGQLKKYLPTLQLKKAMLQTEVNLAKAEVSELLERYEEEKQGVGRFSHLLSKPNIFSVYEGIEIDEVQKFYESIAGVEIPHFQDVTFKGLDYLFYDKPFWFDEAILRLRVLIKIKEEIRVVEEKRDILQKELREVSIRVNLFEKILIPRTQANIKKIKIFLGDQQLAAVSQAKIAKSKIEARESIEGVV